MAAWLGGRAARGRAPTPGAWVSSLACALACSLTAASLWAEPRARFADLDAEPVTPAAAASAPVSPPVPSAGFTRNLAVYHLERGRTLEARGDIALALGEYSQAIAIDTSYGDAYLKLGALRERMGDPREAELVYTTAAANSATRSRALLARGQLRRRAGRTQEALADLEASAELDPSHDTLVELGSLYTEQRAWPAALAVYRRLLLDAERAGDQRASDETRLQVRALRVLAGDVDITRYRGTPHDWVRLSLSSIAKR